MNGIQPRKGSENLHSLQVHVTKRRRRLKKGAKNGNIENPT